MKLADDYCSTTTNNYITGKLQLLYNFQLGDHKSAHLQTEMVCEAFNCQPATNVFRSLDHTLCISRCDLSAVCVSLQQQTKRTGQRLWADPSHSDVNEQQRWKNEERQDPVGAFRSGMHKFIPSDLTQQVK